MRYQAAAITPVDRDEVGNDAGARTLSIIAATTPVLAATGLLVAFAIGESAGVQILAVSPSANIAEAAAYGEAAQMLAFLASGQDPNVAWPLRSGLIDSGSPLHVTPLQAAILARREGVALLLLRRGARADNAEQLACLAQAVGKGDSLPPRVFGASKDTYYSGPVLEAHEALRQCGFALD